MAVPLRATEPDVDGSGTRSPRRVTTLVFAALPALLLLLVAEIVVRWTGAADTCTAPILEKSPLWECDPLLHFRTKRTMVIEGRPMNSLGFRASEIGPKRDGTLRVLALGDSCTFGWIARSEETTFFVPAPYPDLLQRAINDVTPGEVFNAGVSGYNSYHGLMLLRTKLRGLAPDLITVRFGWNDALAGRMDGGGSSAEPETAIGRAVESMLLRTALFPFAKRLSTALYAPPAPAKGTMPEMPTQWTPVVPLENYKHNLRRIIEEGRAQGAQVFLLTSPHSFLTDEYRGRETNLDEARAALFMMSFSGVRSYPQLVAIRDAYNAATEEVGRETGAPVVDLVAAYRVHAAEHLFTALDVIHPNQRGHEIEADAIFARMREEGLVP